MSLAARHCLYRIALNESARLRLLRLHAHFTAERTQLVSKKFLECLRKAPAPFKASSSGRKWAIVTGTPHAWH